MADQQRKSFDPEAIGFAGDQDAWDHASPEFKDRFLAAMLHMAGLGPKPPPGEASMDEVDEEEYEGQTEVDRQRQAEEAPEES